ncbi:MAG: hypothetical protein H8D56_00430 [Planctomycetes bacterium]|nr:hypothetical protein [Planctomycetota bacterium]MBL7147167.1 hypothetical protein [Phycisphaerae bacterium]
MSIENLTLAHFRHFSHFRHSFNYNIFPDTLFMQNKPNLRNDKMNINIDMTTNYKILSRWRGQKTKPIQSQFKPNQSQFKPILRPGKAKQSQFKPNLTKGKK